MIKNAIIALLVIVGLMFLPAVLNPESATVLKVCNESRQVIDGELEEKCGALQDATNTEFLCDGIEASAHCWVEKK